MSAGQHPNLSLWREKFESLDTCPWPGPRPLRTTDGYHLLVGRDREKNQFRREVGGTTLRLILLTGESGVGKTSLLEAGLIPGLRESGYEVALCRDWSGSAEQSDPVAFLAAKVRTAFSEQKEFLQKVPELPSGRALFWALNRELPGRCVLVLDQFEELIRDAPAMTEQLFKLLIEINHRTELRVVISFRSEYLHEMADLEAGVKAYTMSHVALKQVDPDVVRDVVLAANHDGQVAIEEVAADWIAQLWHAARGENGPDSLTRRVQLGLLHLQALLYVLAAQAGGEPVTMDHVKKLTAELTPGELFVHSLEQAVRVKLQRCRDASVSVGLDWYLVEGTTRSVVDAVRHLSSAGYKLVRDARDLMSATLGGRHETLTRALASSSAGDGSPPDGPLQDNQLNMLLNVLLDTTLSGWPEDKADLLGLSRPDIASACDQEFPVPVGGHGWAERLHQDAPPASADPFKVSCGPMFGLAPAAVLVEELRRFVLALYWLQASSLIRISTPGSGGAMVALIHDGFGAALEHWAQSASIGPSFELAALTSPQGGSFDWKSPTASEPEWPELDGTQGTAVLANLRWRGAWVRANIRQVTFVNCDLRGTAFDGCVFEGVAFVNCLLDGAMFSDCTISGAASPAREWSKKQPTFVVEAGAPLVAVLGQYRVQEAGGSRLLSQLPGLPAVPTQTADHSGAYRLDQERGGLVIYGGRVSSLIVRSCGFTAHGCLSVRNVAGSGFEVVEQSGGRFEFFGSALRHLEFSRVITAADPDSAVPAMQGDELQVELTTSSIAQAWFGAGLRGRLLVTDCLLVQLWNGSPDLAASAGDCTFHGIVGVDMGRDCTPIRPGEDDVPLAEVLTDPSVMPRTLRMDYRRDPSAESSAAEETPPRPAVTGSAKS
jgi:hypothetical protein